MLLNVPTAPGEFLDKLTILEIKVARIADAAKLANVRRELDLMRRTWEASPLASSNVGGLVSQLRTVNEALWDIEDRIGDKELAREVLISNFMNKPGVILPSDTAMRADLDAFITDTYRRFLVRDPSEAERTWFRNMIAADPNITSELVYYAFALSNEHLYY